MPAFSSLYRIFKKDGQYFVAVPVQASRRTSLYPAGSTRREAEEFRRKLLADLKKTTWRLFENYCKSVDEGAIWKELAEFRARAAEEFNRTRRFFIHSDYPDVVRRMKDGLVNALRRAGFEFEIVTTDDLRKGKLSECDLILFPGGGGYGPEKSLAEKIKKFVRDGGGYIGICAGAFFALRPSDGKKGPLELLDSTHHYFRESGLCHLMINPDDPIGTEIKSSTRPPKTALYKRVPAARKHTVHVRMLRGNGPLIRPGPNTKVTAFFDTTEGYAAIVHGVYGKGRVAVFSPHPEVCAETARLGTIADGIECGKLLKNAVLYCAGF